MTERGTLFIVVGPSGAGKDTLIAAARTRLAGNPKWVFPRRIIDRPVVPDPEIHEAVTTPEFERRRAAGAFSLTWAAHGHRYALPRGIEDDLAQGRHVVANVSRSVVADARARFRPCRVIVVTASPAILAERLAARGRESAEDVRERLERTGDVIDDGMDTMTVLNDGPIEFSINDFLKAILAS